MKWNSLKRALVKSNSLDKILYLSVALSFLGVSLDLYHKKNELEEVVLGLEVLTKETNKRTISGPKVQKVHFDRENRLSPFYCGVDREQVIIFKFEPHGTLKSWVQHFSKKGFTFPPTRKPQRVSTYHFNGDSLYWSLNLFGEPFNYRSPILEHKGRDLSQLVLKSGPRIFSPLNCQLLSGLL